MSDVRMQPKSAPRSTGIARTTVTTNKATNSGSSVSASPASSPAVRAHAQNANASRMQPVQSASRGPLQGQPLVGSMAPGKPNLSGLSHEEIMLMGGLADEAMGKFSGAIASTETPAQGKVDAKHAMDLAQGLMNKLELELRSRR